VLLFRFLVVFVALSSFARPADAQGPDPADAICARFTAGAAVSNPPEVRSQNGVLETTLTFKAAVDAAGLTRYCYINEKGFQSPTLRAKQGDLLIIHFRNALAPATGSPSLHAAHIAAGSNLEDPCRGKPSVSSTNLHFHGMSIPAACHQDEVIHTAIEAGTSFDYRFRIPVNEPPGMYWYHPHVHGTTQKQLQGGASAALIVEGIQAKEASLTGLGEHILVIRDQPLSAAPDVPQASAPSWDLSVNYVPVAYPGYEPASIHVKPRERQFWRVVNAAANTILNLQVVAGGVPQALQVFSIDGAPISGGPLRQENILLGPGARAEFVLTTPPAGESAQLITEKWDAGPAGDNDPYRPLATIISTKDAQASVIPAMPKQAQKASLPAVAATVERRLYFRQSGIQDDDDKSATSGAPNNDANTRFYILVDGYRATSFDMNAPPTLIVHQGTVEDWIVSNATFEDHVFHIHQIHFQLLEVDGQPVTDPVSRDTINIPHRTRNAPPPSVKVRMDFRGSNVVGIFMYQCHIVAHQEGGMMGSIQVLPPGEPTSLKLLTPTSTVPLGQAITITAKVVSAAQGLKAPVGTVQFEADGHLEGPPIPLAGGEAARTFSFYSSGPHTVGATYSGDAKYEASQAQQVRISAHIAELKSPSQGTGTLRIEVPPNSTTTTRARVIRR
jgi:FtsP/CotA-like multicopper oxidase with cupredoxin domain